MEEEEPSAIFLMQHLCEQNAQMKNLCKVLICLTLVVSADLCATAFGSGVGSGGGSGGSLELFCKKMLSNVTAFR